MYEATRGHHFRGAVHYSRTLNEKMSFHPPRFEGRQKVTVGDEWR